MIFKRKKTEKKNENIQALEPELSDEKKEIENTDETPKAEGNKEELDKAEQTVKKAGQKKKKWINLIFFFINIGVVVGILMYQLWGSGDGFVPIEDLPRFNLLPFFMIFLVFLTVFLIDSIIIAYMIKKDTGKFQFALSFKTTVVGRYYDNITPLAVGGQPFQATYLNKRGVNSAAALSIPVAKAIFQQLATFLISTIALIISFTDSTYNTLVSVASIIGFILSFSMLFIMAFLSMSKKLGKKLVVGVLKLLQKMRIIKNYEKQYQKVTKYIEDFQNIMRAYAKSPKDFILMFGLSLLRLIAYFSVLFFIYWVFNGYEPQMYIKLFVSGILVELAASFFPLPGGTGANEISFTALFGGMFASGSLFWALIIWRTFSYYGVLLLGLIVLTYDISYGDRKYKWNNKQRQLQEESQIFRQVQIQKFRKERNTRRKKVGKNMA